MPWRITEHNKRILFRRIFCHPKLRRPYTAL